ncbi:hypothetical protein AJ87_46015 [Rhizobium yanglingense]|nr:hypothetical protein AJ87_46015 [Rhizobium yanglingense]
MRHRFTAYGRIWAIALCAIDGAGREACAPLGCNDMKHSGFAEPGKDSGALFTLELREALRGFSRDQRHDQLAGE